MTEVEQRKAEQAALYKYAAIRHAENDLIGAARIYIDMTEDWPAALVLDELMFWTLPKSKTGKTSLKIYRDGYTWLAVSRSEWWERKRLSERQADRAIDKLISLGLVVKDVFKFNAQPTVHLRLNTTRFFELLASKIAENYQDEGENITTELKDLYEMMGVPNSPNGEIEVPNSPFGEAISPFGDTNSPNGEMINSTNQHSPVLTLAADVETAKTKKALVDGVKAMDVLLDMERQADPTIRWQGREKLPETIRDFADAWVNYTGIKPQKKELAWWMGEWSDWISMGAIPDDVKAGVAYAKEHGFDLFQPASLTKTLRMLVAKRKQSAQAPTYKDYTGTGDEPVVKRRGPMPVPAALL